MRPVPTQKAVKYTPSTMIVSRTNTKGIIEYVNHDFCEISGYTQTELIGKPHNFIRHPDMPRAIFKLMWDRIQGGNDIYAVVKNLAKNGDHYWVTTKFDIRTHPVDGGIAGYVAYRQIAPSHVVDEIKKLYADLLEIERANGLDASIGFLNGFLDAKQTTYDNYIKDLAVHESGFKSLFKKLFG